jgi:hypothetical protein
MANETGAAPSTVEKIAAHGRQLGPEVLNRITGTSLDSERGISGAVLDAAVDARPIPFEVNLRVGAGHADVRLAALLEVIRCHEKLGK